MAAKRQAMARCINLMQFIEIVPIAEKQYLGKPIADWRREEMIVVHLSKFVPRIFLVVLVPVNEVSCKAAIPGWKRSVPRLFRQERQRPP